MQDENADTVRIMSIHKSKGLEFPICFVAGLSKKFNMQDTMKPVIMDMDYGIALDYVDIDSRVRGSTLKKAVLSGKLRRDLSLIHIWPYHHRREKACHYVFIQEHPAREKAPDYIRKSLRGRSRSRIGIS